MSRRLQSFVKKHPEFFEEKDGLWRLSSDIRDLMERYARAYNKEEFERMKVLVEEAKEKERERLQQEIDHWTAECEEEQEKARKIEAQLHGIDSQMHEAKQRVENSEAAQVPKPVPPRSWYHSGAVFSMLAMLGMLFFYMGIILTEHLSLSYIVAGACCVAVGLYLQSGNPSAQTASGSSREFHSMVVKEERGFIKIACIKRATLSERKRVANQNVAAFNRKINRSLAKLNTLNG